MTSKSCAAGFPVLERKTYLNSGSYCALADTVKAGDQQLHGRPVARGSELGRLGDEERVGAVADGAGVARRAGRDRRDGVRFGGHQRACERVRFHRQAQQGRDQRLRIPHQRPDLACAGAARRQGSPRPRAMPTVISRWSTSRRPSTRRRNSLPSPTSASATAPSWIFQGSSNSRTPRARK